MEMRGFGTTIRRGKVQRKWRTITQKEVFQANYLWKIYVPQVGQHLSEFVCRSSQSTLELECPKNMEEILASCTD